MLTSIEGIYRDGKIELAEDPAGVHGEVRVIVTFLPVSAVDLQTRGMNMTEVDELRSRLASFADEWNSPEMDIYDNYDAASRDA